MKLGIAALLVGLGLWIGFRAVFILEAERAVLSRPVMVLRTPITGSIDKDTTAEGALVQADTPVFSVYDARVDLSREIELTRLRDRLRGEVASAERVATALHEMHSAFSQRDRSNRSVQRVQLEKQLAEANAAEEAQRALLMNAEQEVQRSRALDTVGIESQRDLERAEMQLWSATAAAERSKYQRQGLRSLVDAVSRGALVDTSAGVGFTYARQKVDEVSLRLLQQQQELERLHADLAGTEASLSREQSRTKLLTRADVTPGKGARIWRRFVSRGSHVVAGQALAEALDCSAAYVSALVYVRQARKLRVGSRARVSLRDDDASYAAEVVNIGASGGGTGGWAPVLAAPPNVPGTMDELVPVVVRLSDQLPATLGSCAAGVDAEIRF